MIKIKEISKSYGSLTVLANVSFTLDGPQRAALVGSNGTGKSTLLRIIAGLIEADSGDIEIGKATRLGYLPQDTSLVGGRTIREYLRSISGIDSVQAEMDGLVDHLTEPSKKRKYEEVQELYERLGGYSFEHRMEIMLAGFGLEDIEPERPLDQLSSGQKSKIALIGILLKGVDLLLLDEPTNNLDLPALIWLEEFLRRSPATAIIVSHDRRFLDRVTDKVMELDWRTHSLSVTNGNYSEYLRMSTRRRARHKQEYRLQQEEIARLTDQAREMKHRASRGSSWSGSDNDKFLRGFNRDRAGRSGKAAKAIEKRIDQMDKIEALIERDPFELPLTPELTKPDREVRIVEVVAGYTNFRIGPITMTIRYGERIGIVGFNGSGKSSLLRVVTGHQQPLSGSVSVGSGVRLGDMMQEHESLPREMPLIEFLRSRAGLADQDAYNLLKKFGFNPEQATKPISSFSPGARARLLLALFSAQSVNTLILDEPTNHLDLEATEALEEALEGYEGTILLVSHDRYFLEKAKLDATYLLDDGKLTKIPDYKTYVQQAEASAERLLRIL